MTPLGSVYGGALYALAKDEGLSDRILSEVKVLSSAFSENEGFLRILSAPNLPKEERLSILDKSFRGQVHPYLLNFMKILTQKGSIRHFSECAAAYEGLYNEDNGILPVRAVSATPLSAEQTARLTQKLAAQTGKRIALTCKVDKNVLGGLMLDYDGKRVDDTVRHRLDEVKRLLEQTML